MTRFRFGHALTIGVAVLILAGCGGSNSTSSTLPSAAGPARVRFVDGAADLEELVGGQAVGLGPYAFLQVNSQTVVSQFSYSVISPFMPIQPGTLSLVARNSGGYSVGPLKTTTAISAGGRYTVIVVGTFPHYKVLTFEEPATSSDAQLSLYEASPSVPQAAFGSYRASNRSDFKQLGSAKLGSVATVSLGKSVTDFGGYVGSTNNQLGDVTPNDVNAYNKHNDLPFKRTPRLSLFLFDPGPGSGPAGPVFGSLDP